MRHRTDPEALRRTQRLNRAEVTIDDPNRGANKADVPRNSAGMAGMSLVKSDESHRAPPGELRGFILPGNAFRWRFHCHRIAPSSRSGCPDLEQRRGAFSHEDRTAALEGRREGKQAAGISEISGFAAQRLAGRAAQLLRTLLPLIAGKLSRAGSRAPRACVE